MTKLLFQEFTYTRSLISAFSFENEEFIFPGIANVVRFSLITLSGSGEAKRNAELAFYIRRMDQLGDRRRRFSLEPEEFRLLNPNTQTCPIFRSLADADLTKNIYRTIPVLIDEGSKPNINPWGIVLQQNFFSHTTDGDLFKTAAEEVAARERQRYLPLYEAKFVWHYDHRFGSYHNLGKAKGRGGRGLPPVTREEHASPDFGIKPRHWVDSVEVENRLRTLGWHRDWLLGWRDVASSKLERTVVATVIPKAATDDSFSLLFPEGDNSRLMCCLLANLNAIVFDYFARQKVGARIYDGTRLSNFRFCRRQSIHQRKLN
jgi:hypothetical protein